MNNLTYIVTRTPLRVSFFGGGTDISYFYKKYSGRVISSTINRFVYVTVKSYDATLGKKYKLNYSHTELVKKNIANIKNNIIRECLKFSKIKESLEICISTDVPPSSGLGTSSAIVVGLLKALYTYKGVKISKTLLAKNACEVEINILKNPIGKQDQYNAVYGGFKSYKFLKNDKVIFKNLNNILIKKIFSRALFLWVGNFKESNKILTAQKKLFNIKQKHYLELLSVVNSFDKLNNNNSFNIKKFAELLDKSWNIKKKLSNLISNSNINKLYSFAKKHGAIGGKLLGAGSGGFLFLIFLKLDKAKLLKIFKNKKIYFFYPYSKGSEVIYNKIYK
jgi:D-glycero-alpha-D-manno-heptose-7-phosphate kinase